MKKTLRGIGIGIFLVGALWTAFETFFPSNAEQEIALLKQQLQDSENKVKHLQETAQVTPEQTTDEQSTDKAEQPTDAKTPNEEPVAEEKPAEEAPAPTEEQPAANDVVTGTILIYENVSLYDIGKQAEDAGIVENGRELELYLYKPEYSRSIQIGQFELSSDMTLEQMAKILTGKN